MSGTSESRGSHGAQGSPSPKASVVPVVPAPSGGPKQSADLGDLAYPWKRTCPGTLRPWLDPAFPCQDPWQMAEQSGLLHGNQEFAQWSKDPGSRQRPDLLRTLREALASQAWGRMSTAWAHRRASLEKLPSPTLPREVVRLLPPQASHILADAWLGCLKAMLWHEWNQGPTSSWAMKVLVRPFGQPEPANIPAPPLSPGPDVWLAWTSPEPGRMEPLLVLATQPPMAGELPELRHRDSGMIVVPTVVGTAVSLEQPQTESIIRGVAHYGGVWVDETSAES
jgi:hypothetical protein